LVDLFDFIDLQTYALVTLGMDCLPCKCLLFSPVKQSQPFISFKSKSMAINKLQLNFTGFISFIALIPLPGILSSETHLKSQPTFLLVDLKGYG